MSRNWRAGDRSPEPTYGERDDARQRWRNGYFPLAGLLQRAIGRPDQIAGDNPCPPNEGELIHGLPADCWSKRVATGCDLAALSINDCIRATGPTNTVQLSRVAGGEPDAIYLDRPTVDVVQLLYPSDKWVSEAPLEYPADPPEDSPGELVAWYAQGLVHLSLSGKELMHCGNGCWRGGPLTGHTAQATESCAGVTFDVCLTCHCCTIPGFDGEGAYCIENTGPDDCMAVWLTESDGCDTDIIICSGPYPSLAEANTVCGTVEPVTRPCGGPPFNTTAAEPTFQTGDATCIGSLSVAANSWTTIICEGNMGFTLSCVDGFYTLTSGQPCTITLIAESATELVWFIEVPPLVLKSAPSVGGTFITTATGNFP
jgi:hypothetical protein